MTLRKGERKGWNERAEINKQGLCGEGHGEVPWRGPRPLPCPEGSGLDSWALLVSLSLKKDESHCEKEGRVSLLGSGVACCVAPHSHSCVCSRAQRPSAFRGSPSAPHPPREAQLNAKEASPSLRTLASRFGLQVNDLLGLGVTSLGQVPSRTVRRKASFSAVLVKVLTLG